MCGLTAAMAYRYCFRSTWSGLFKATSTTEIYTYRHTRSLHDSRPISGDVDMFDSLRQQRGLAHVVGGGVGVRNGHFSFSPLPQAGGEPNTARYSVTTLDATSASRSK